MKHHNKSLVRACMLYFVVYSLAALLLILLLNLCVNRWIESLFQQADIVNEYQTELKYDAFDRIPEKKLNNIQYAVYDGNGKLIHVQGEKLKEYLKRLNRDLIREYDNNSYLQSYRYQGEDGKLYHAVAKFQYDNQENAFIIRQYAIMDDDYRQIRGNLLETGEMLSPEDIQFVDGEYADYTDIYRYDYKTADGNSRTLISMSMVGNQERYYEMLDVAQRLWITLIPILLLLILIQSVLFGRKIRKSIKPLDDAIVRYGKGSTELIPDGQIPEEFSHVMRHFEWMSQELDRANSEKEQEQQERRRYIAGITHDLSTPLTAILGYSKAICDGMVDRDRERIYMETIYRKAVLCQELMQNFFEYIKLEHPDRVIRLEKTDLGEMLRQSLIEKMPEIQLHGFSLEPDIPEGPVLVGIDRSLLLRGFDNLISNALRYNDPGTTIYVGLRKQGASAVLTIADNGKGIPKQIQKDLFRPFVTGNTARTPGKGTGFGMAVTKKAVELHGGTIFLVNPPNPEYRTEIRIILPLWGSAQ